MRRRINKKVATEIPTIPPIPPILSSNVLARPPATATTEGRGGIDGIAEAAFGDNEEEYVCIDVYSDVSIIWLEGLLEAEEVKEPLDEGVAVVEIVEKLVLVDDIVVDDVNVDVTVDDSEIIFVKSWVKVVKGDVPTVKVGTEEDVEVPLPENV